MTVGLVVVGGSWGGLDAACHLLQAMPAPLTVPLLLVLHRAPTSQAHVLRTVVRRCSGQDLVEVEDKTLLTPGAVHLAPADYHVLVEDAACSLTTDAPVNGSRPSIDLAFESAAYDVGDGLSAGLLSGTGRDGARGLAAARAAGGRTYAQTPATAEKGEMPQAAIDLGAAQVVATPEEIGAALAALVRTR